MTIYEWVKSRGLKIEWAAKNIFHCSYYAIWRLEKTGKCDGYLAWKVFEITEGKVDYRTNFEDINAIKEEVKQEYPKEIRRPA